MTTPRTIGDAAWFLGSRAVAVLAVAALFLVALVVVGLSLLF